MAVRYASATPIVDYNPQSWAQETSAGGSYRSHASMQPTIPLTADLTSGPLPSPPPPYSQSDGPGTSINLPHTTAAGPRPGTIYQRQPNSPSGAAVYSTPTSAIGAGSPFSQQRLRQGSNANAHTPSPSGHVVAPSFPPPPGSTRDRSSSRTREMRSGLFNLGGLRGKPSDRSSGQAIRDTTFTAPAIAFSRHTSNIEPLALNGHLAGSSASSDRRAATSDRSHMDTQWDQAPTYFALQTTASAPPAARRSASAGDMRSVHHGGSIPPPPPGPPPASMRSLSIDRGSSNVPIISAPVRRPPHRGTALGPVPPTPANWSDDPPTLPPGVGYAPELGAESRVVPSVAHEHEDWVDSSRHDHSGSNGSSGLDSQGAAPSVRVFGRMDRREPSVKGIRERRSESKAARDRVPQPVELTLARSSAENMHSRSDLPLRSPGSAGISRQGAVKKTRKVPTPLTSPGNAAGGDLGYVVQASLSPYSPALASSNTPRTRDLQNLSSMTGPPPPGTPASQCDAEVQATPLSGRETSSPKARRKPMETERQARQIPVSIDDSPSSNTTLLAESFLTRCADFAAKETLASTDQERLELFAKFFVNESRLRRDRYADAFAEMAGDVFDLTRDLWKSLIPGSARVASDQVGSGLITRQSSSRHDSLDSYVSSSSPFSVKAMHTPATEADSPAESAYSANAREGQPWRSYQPVLSPIPSMAMSTVPDEENSRGRAPSRWWESDQGSQLGERTSELERSRRESKYMSLQREARFNLQYELQPSSSPGLNLTPRGIPDGASGFPSEKLGFGNAATPSKSSYAANTSDQSALTRRPSDSQKLDVSRLVTLPPPYPRHFPAMNNNHPDLSSARNTLRNLVELDGIRDVKDRFQRRLAQRQEGRAEEALSRANEMRHNIQEQISLGQMTFQSAASAEADFKINESHLLQEAAKSDFDLFKNEVRNPLFALLSESITKASACIAQLEASLETSSHDISRNQQLQEEGDEQPEMLEKLNLLKWLFEAREGLHREMFDLEADQDHQYGEVVMTPMRNAGNQARLLEIAAFFARDGEDRKQTFHIAKAKRWEEFASSIQIHVARATEAQLNAFWDIAPDLMMVVQQVPEQIDVSVQHGNFAIQVPDAEMTENPSYMDHPMQYLHSLLSHAEKSTYQFIEAQTNLLCLQHEALSSAMAAKLLEMESRQCQQEVRGGANSSGHTGIEPMLQEELVAIRQVEEHRLTTDLKDKVALVESQWREALGAGLGECRERVARYLVETGGWDDMLSD